MITIRNEDKALSLSARASTADLVSGMIVVAVQGAASGDQPKVRKATAAEIKDVKVQKFIVEYDAPDSTEVDFNINTVTQGLTPIAKTIPLNAQVNIWMGTVVIAYHESLLPAGFKAADAREASPVVFDSDTNLPAAYSAGGSTDATDTVEGFVYRVDGPEVTLVVKL